MAKFDSMYFENNRCHVLAGIRNAEKSFNDGDAEGVKIALDCAFGHLGNMRNEIERNSETVEARKALVQYDEMKAKYYAIKAKYDEKYGKIEELDPEEVEIEDEEAENDEVETTENEEVEEEKNAEKKNEDASIVKLNVAVRNAINILSAIKESEIKSDDLELIDSTLLLLDELAEVVENDFDDILERLEDAKKDAEIIAKVEAVKEAFDLSNRDKIVEDTIERLRKYKDRDKGIEDVELTNEAIFAVIHQESDDLKIEFEVVSKGIDRGDNVWRANRFGVERDRYGDGPSLVYEVETNADGWSRDLNLLLKKMDNKRVPLATIRFRGYDDDTIRKISALGCEYALAFKNIAKNI